jgi:hypothetical protein
LNKSPIQASPLPEVLAGTAWEPSKLPNYVSITPPSITVVSLTTPLPPTAFFSLSLSLSLSSLKRNQTSSRCGELRQAHTDQGTARGIQRSYLVLSCIIKLMQETGISHPASSKYKYLYT